MANKNTKSIELKECFLHDVDGNKYQFDKAAVGFAYYESIFSPFVSAVLNVADSGGNFISKIPIQGGEKVTLKIEDVEEKVYEFELYVWKVYNRSFTKSLQNYNLALVSKEALYNEGVRLTKLLKGAPRQQKVTLRRLQKVDRQNYLVTLVRHQVQQDSYSLRTVLDSTSILLTTTSAQVTMSSVVRWKSLPTDQNQT